MLSYRFTSLIGVLVLLGIAVLLSEKRRAISPRLVIIGVGLQFGLAGLLLAFPPMVAVFELLARAVNRLISFGADGARFVLGAKLVDTDGPLGFVFAVQVLPVLIYLAALMAVLYHFGVMQRVVGVMAWLLRRCLGVSGTEALATAANVFVGQTEAPLCVKPYIPGMTRSQLMVLMTAGFATVSGSTLAAYVLILGGDEPTRILFTRHLLIASLMSAPAALVMAKIIVPETDGGVHHGALDMTDDVRTRNVLDAVTVGATDGLRLALNVGAMLIAFVALLAMLDWPLALLSEWEPMRELRAYFQLPVLSVQSVLGVLLAPVSLVMGVPWSESFVFGGLLGTKIVATEFIAFGVLADLLHQTEVAGISRRTSEIALYALCGFANFASIGIQIGALTALAPARKPVIVSLALRAMIAGALASWTTACIAGLFIG